MARTLTFQTEHRYLRRIYDNEAVWVPEINAKFRSPNGKSRTGTAILDTGSPWCAMPRDVAAFLGIDVDSCPLQRTQPIEGPEVFVPYTYLSVRALGVDVECKVLLNNSGLYLVGRVPFFSMLEIAFHEEEDGRGNRILVSTK